MSGTSLIGRVVLYARTVRHLRWRQVSNLATRRFRSRFTLRPRFESVRTANVQALSKTIMDYGVDPARDFMKRADEIVAGRFLFLNHEETLSVIDWGRRYVNPLWTYNLHYFDYARDLAWAYRRTRDDRYPKTFEQLILSWLEQPKVTAGVRADPYPVSLRCVNWIHALLLFGDGISATIQKRIEVELFRQLLHLEDQIEWHLMGNHVIANMKALVHGGIFFDGARARRWRQQATEQLWQQLRDQILDDGMHCERSPMYHSIVLSDLFETLACLEAAEAQRPAVIDDIASRMTSALMRFRRFDGSLHLWGDSAQGVAPSPDFLISKAKDLLGAAPVELASHWVLPASGFHGFRDLSRGVNLIISCSVPSPVYQPGHSHNDILSFELDFGGEAIVVDSGIHGYDGDEFREYVRSTRAHNTVVIGGKEQSEVWKTFRFGRRANSARSSSSLEEEGLTFEGSYRPYHRNEAVHTRKIRLDQSVFEVRDLVADARGEPLESTLHFSPHVTVVFSNDQIILSVSGLKLLVEPWGVDRIFLVKGQRDPMQGWQCPELGVARQQFVLRMVVDTNRGHEFGYRISELA